MSKKEKKQKEKKPDEKLSGAVAAHLVIIDKKSGKEIVNQRG